MPSTTLCANLPFPTDGDPIDVAGDIARLALAADTAICRVNGLPLGAIIPWWDNGGALPEGTLRCDGSSFVDTSFPELAVFLGATVLPDLRGRFLRGTDAAGGAFPGRGQTGGFADTQLPNHTHTVPIHGHGAQTLGGGGVDHLHGTGSLATAAAGNHDHGWGPGTQWAFKNAGSPLGFPITGNPGNVFWWQYLEATWSASGNHAHTVVGQTGASDRGLDHNHPVQVFNQAAFDTVASGATPTNRNLPPFANVTFLIQAIPNL